MSESTPSREGEPVELTDEQQRRARAALRAFEEGVATKPQHLTEWKAPPSWSELQAMSETDDDEFAESVEKWVPVSNIVGISDDLVDDFMEGRMTGALRLLIDNEFQPHYEDEDLYYREICGDLYVSLNGSHRSIACKTVGIDEVYANVEHVDVTESEYREWVARRDGTYESDDDDDQRPDPPPEYRSPMQRFREWLGGLR